MSVIMHNMTASFTSKQLNITSGKKTKSAEKLGSGYRINRSADDAAGLQISEKMRAQIKGLNKASSNAEEGVSLIQTAEGALNEVHSILQRMNELATQAANDTNTGIDRCAIQQEMDELRSEISRISNATLFNDRPVLKVPQLVEISGDVYSQAPLNQSVGVQQINGGLSSHNGVTMDFKNITSANINELVGKKFDVTCSVGCAQTFTFEFINADSANSTTQLIDHKDANGDMTRGSDLKIQIGINDLTDGQAVVDKIVQMVTDAQQDVQDSYNDFDSTFTFSPNHLYVGHGNGVSSDGTVLKLYSVQNEPYGELFANALFKEEEKIYFQIGAKAEADMEYTIRTINLETLKLYDTSVMDHESAKKTMQTVQDAINITSQYRSYLGSVQNRLEHTIANLDNTAENTQAAESNIRDTDMAAEMVELSKNNILEQVGQSVLAQANQSTQGILSLLQ